MCTPGNDSGPFRGGKLKGLSFLVQKSGYFLITLHSGITCRESLHFLFPGQGIHNAPAHWLTRSFGIGTDADSANPFFRLASSIIPDTLFPTHVFPSVPVCWHGLSPFSPVHGKRKLHHFSTTNF